MLINVYFSFKYLPVQPKSSIYVRFGIRKPSKLKYTHRCFVFNQNFPLTF